MAKKQWCVALDYRFLVETEGDDEPTLEENIAALKQFIQNLDNYKGWDGDAFFCEENEDVEESEA